MVTTLKDIARQSGVSISTVSRVINKKSTKYRISEETEKLVLQTAEKLRYQPNQLARGLRVRKTQTIGLVVPDISNPFFSYVCRNIQTISHKLGYSLVVCNTDDNLDLEIEHINLLWSKGVDGLIVMPVGQKYGHLEKIVEEKVPLVLIDRCFDDLPVSSVVVDNYRGAFDAVDHLASYGHQRIGIIQGLPNTFTNDGRLRGYRDALEKYRLAFDEKLVVGREFRKETGYIETKLLLHLPDPPTALFSTSDLITLGVLRAIDEEGYSIPGDVSLISFDDIEFAPYLRCPLTTVVQPKEHMGEIAVKLLNDQMKNPLPGGEQRVVLRPKLVIRDSVRKMNRNQGTPGELSGRLY
jgi:LacI family transcriptional regulator